MTTSKAVVVHFFHEDFVRCKIVDKHMGEVARKYASTKFIRVDATKALHPEPYILTTTTPEIWTPAPCTLHRTFQLTTLHPDPEPLTFTPGALLFLFLLLHYSRA